MVPVLPSCQYPGLVRTDFIMGRDRATGTGFIADKEGDTAIVLTCAHGYKALMQAEVITQNGRRLAAEVLGADPVNDLCVLWIKDPGLPAMRIAAAPPKPGDRVYMAGYAGGVRYNGNWGVLTNFVQPNRSGPATFLDCTCRVEGGDSGGPILVTDGGVVGIVTGGGPNCVGPCLPLLLPTLKLHRQPFTASGRDGIAYCQSGGPLLPWRKGLLAEERKTNQALGTISGQIQAIASQPVAPLPVAPSWVGGNCPPPGPDYGPQISQITATLSKHDTAIGELAKVTDDIKDVVSVRLKVHEKLEGVKSFFGGGDGDEEGIVSRLEGRWSKWALIIGGIVALVYWHKNKHGPVAGLLERAGRPKLAERETAIIERLENRIRGGVAAAATGNPLVGAAVSKASDIEDRLERRFKDLLEARLTPAPGQPAATPSTGKVGPLGQ